MPEATTPTTVPRAVSLADLTTIEGLVATNPEALTVSMLRWQLRHRHETGLDSACVRAGKRILISRTRYESWLASQIGA